MRSLFATERSVWATQRDPEVSHRRETRIIVEQEVRNSRRDIARSKEREIDSQPGAQRRGDGENIAGSEAVCNCVFRGSLLEEVVRHFGQGGVLFIVVSGYQAQTQAFVSLKFIGRRLHSPVAIKDFVGVVDPFRWCGCRWPGPLHSNGIWRCRAAASVLPLVWLPAAVSCPFRRFLLSVWPVLEIRPWGYLINLKALQQQKANWSCERGNSSLSGPTPSH
jgi:hypothetical protein